MSDRPNKIDGSDLDLPDVGEVEAPEMPSGWIPSDEKAREAAKRKQELPNQHNKGMLSNIWNGIKTAATTVTGFVRAKVIESDVASLIIRIIDGVATAARIIDDDQARKDCIDELKSHALPWVRALITGDKDLETIGRDIEGVIERCSGKQVDV